MYALPSASNYVTHFNCIARCFKDEYSDRMVQKIHVTQHCVQLNVQLNVDFKIIVILSVASLGWVSPGAATEGVSPIFPAKNLRPFFKDF